MGKTIGARSAEMFLITKDREVAFFRGAGDENLRSVSGGASPNKG